MISNPKEIISCPNGRIDGSYEELLNFLRWSIVSERYGDMGTNFILAIQNLKSRFNVEVSTFFLKNLVKETPKEETPKEIGATRKTKTKTKTTYSKSRCMFIDKDGFKRYTPIRNKDNINRKITSGIRYLLNKAEFKTEPCKANFKGGIVNGQRCIVPKIFSILISKNDWSLKELARKKFWEECNAYWDCCFRELDNQRLSAIKLEMISNFDGSVINQAELEELSPDIKKQDIELLRLKNNLRL